MPLLRLNSLWVGPRLGYLERLCLASAEAVGNPITLWTYDPETLEGVPSGTDVRDAAEVMPRERLLRYRENGSVALGANLWRIALLAKGLGCWVDMDFIFLKPFDFSTEYVFGWEHENWINNAVLHAPSDSAMVADLLSIPQPNRRPPWWGPRKSLNFYWQRLRQGRIELPDYPWGTFSAGLVTHVVKRNGLQHEAQKPEVFYPVRWKDARALFEHESVVQAMITEDTRAIHMWHSRLEDLISQPPPAGSYMDMACRKFGVEPVA